MRRELVPWRKRGPRCACGHGPGSERSDRGGQPLFCFKPFFAQAGLAQEAAESHRAAFRLVEQAVVAGNTGPAPRCTTPWQYATVTVEGPARIDLGGGWSDTPPFCIDWGGTVLNIAVLLNGSYPIQTTCENCASHWYGACRTETD